MDLFKNNNNKDDSIKIRVSKVQKEEIKKRLEEKGFKNMTEYFFDLIDKDFNENSK